LGRSERYEEARKAGEPSRVLHMRVCGGGSNAANQRWEEMPGRPEQTANLFWAVWIEKWG